MRPKISRFTRRSLLTYGGTVLGYVFGRHTLLGSVLATKRAHAQSCSHGELYEGFLLLDDGDPLPSCVQAQIALVPQLCGAGNSSLANQSTVGADVSHYISVSSLASVVPWTLFDLGSIPSGTELNDVTLIKLSNGDCYWTSVSYCTVGANSTGVITLTSCSDFARPYPLWSIIPETIGEFDPLYYEQVSHTPVDGLFAELDGGYTSRWIDNDILYELRDEFSTSRNDAIALASNLQTY